MNVLIVEFIGVPGAGKTTLSNSLCDSLAGTEYRYLNSGDAREVLNSRISKEYRDLSPLRKMLYIAKHYGYYKSSLLYILLFSLQVSRRKPKQLLEKAKSYIIAHIFTNKLFEHISREKYDLVFLDEMMLHKTWSLIVPDNTPSNIVLKKIITNFYKQLRVLVIWVDVEPDVAKERLKNRGGTSSRFDYLEDHEINVIFRKHTGLVERIMHQSPKGLKDHSVKINADNSLELNRQICIREIVRFIEEQHCQTSKKV